VGDDTKAAPTPDAEVEPELRPGIEIAGYVIDEKIGQGGMGAVYGAHHPRIGKRVAIKVLSRSYCNDASAVERFEQEARVVNEVRHPNIVDVFQFGELPDKRSFFVMECLTGESLSARIDKAPLSTLEAIEILDAVCDALEAAHEHGVVHRDLKSDNVFLAMHRNKRTVKLLDFGIAKLGKNDLTATGKTASGVIVGTPAYMSPEQARGQPVSPRTDVYQLGVLTYKMLTGKLPFIADNPMDLIIHQLQTPAPSPKKLAPKTPDVLARLIVQMMQKSAEARPTVAEIRRVFADVRDGKVEVDEPPPRTRRMPTVLLGLALFLIGFVGLLVILWVKNKEPAATPAPAAVPSGSSSVAAPPAPPTPPANDPNIDEIEIEPPVATPATPTTPGKKRSKPTADAKEEEAIPVLPPPNRPGAILFTLQVASTIEIDGKTVSSSSTGGRFEVAPGTHEIRVKAPGRQPVTRSVEVLAGGVAIIQIEDDPSPTPTSPTP
jgi:serine/threonine protein kinase